MKRAVILGMVVLSVFLLFCVPAQAAVVTVDVTIKTVNPQARGITVVYKTELGEKTIELDVSRKAEITLNGKEGTIESLGPGLKAKVSFDRDPAIITKIEATGVVVKRKSPELLEVSELNDEGRNGSPWVSEDGLTVYWVRVAASRAIWVARRENSQALFADKKPLFNGATPTVSSDGLEMIVAGDRGDGQEGASLFVATRESLDKPFNRPAEITELRKCNSFGPSISSDGLTLYFCSGSKKMEERDIVCCTRKDRSSPWSDPRRLANVALSAGTPIMPLVTADGLHLFCSQLLPGGELPPSGNLMLWSRSSVTKPFEKHQYITIDNLPPLCGGTPRYVAATNELFFVRQFPKQGKRVQGKQGIWVVKNFTLPESK